MREISKMRFSDTEEGWQEELEKITKNKHSVNFLRAISQNQLMIVKNQADSNLNKIESGAMCHAIVKEKVLKDGGTAISGWQIVSEGQVNNQTYFNRIDAIFHCNWRNEEGILFDLTPSDNKYHIFLKDDKRKYDFDRKETYNNRCIFLDGYRFPIGSQENTHNVTYFTAKGYYSRDRIYERYRRPDTIEQVINELPDYWKTGAGGFTEEAKKWMTLKWSVTLR